MILLAITLKLGMILQNISRRVVDNVLNAISPPTIFPNILLPARFHRNCQAVLAIVSINALIQKMDGAAWRQYQFSTRGSY